MSGWLVNRSPLALCQLERELERRARSDEGDRARHEILDEWSADIERLLERSAGSTGSTGSIGSAQTDESLNAIRALWSGELRETRSGLEALRGVKSRDQGELKTWLIEEVTLAELERPLSPLDRVYAIADQLDELKI